MFSALQPYHQPYNQYRITIMPLLSRKPFIYSIIHRIPCISFFPPIFAGVSASKPVLTLELVPTFPRKWQEILLI